MTCQEKKARRMRKAETLLLGEVFQTFDSFSQSLLSLAELPYSRSQTGGFFTAPKWRKLVFLSDRSSSIEILIYYVSPFFEGITSPQ